MYRLAAELTATTHHLGEPSTEVYLPSVEDAGATDIPSESASDIAYHGLFAGILF